MNVNETERKRKSTKRKTFSQMTEAEFKSLKSLTNAGVKINVVSRATGRATGRANDTVKRVSRATDFEHYRILTKEQTAKYMNPATTHAPEPSEEEVPQVSELTRIADALERLAEAWESTPNKRRLF